MTQFATTVTVGSAPDIPVSYRLIGRQEETSDVVTLRVTPLTGQPPGFVPAQFSMIGVAGVGEVPISISSSVTDRTAHGFTIRRAGAVTNALADCALGDVVTVRGPFGQGWDLRRAVRRHAVFVAGGIGLAPLRAAVEAVVDAGTAQRVSVIVGSAAPEHQIFDSWLWSLVRRGVGVHRTVDDPGSTVRWNGRVGLVTELISDVVDDVGAAAYVCGPDAMMAATVAALCDSGLDLSDIEVTLERNMQCGAGWCGHCQLGPLLLCRDGPVVPATVLADLLDRPEL